MSSIFGGGDNNKTQKVVQSSSPYPAAKPGLDQFYKDLISTYQSGGLKQQPYPGQTVAPVAPETSQAWTDIAQRAQAGSPLTGAASSYIQGILDPSYLTADSPGLQSVIDRARQGVNAEFDRAGRTFSGAHANALDSSEGQLRYSDLLNRMGQQQAAAQFAPTLAQQDYFDANQLGQVGQQRQAQLQDQINAAINFYNAQQAVPASNLGTFSQLLAGGGPGSTSTIQPKAPSANPWLQGIGTAASLASLFYQ